MFEQFILGAVQGIAEWLPVSSEGLIVLVRANFFHADITIADTIREALFLHVGTFLAALVYFRHDVVVLLRALIRWGDADTDTRAIFRFLFISTAITGIIGFAVISGEEQVVPDAIGQYTGAINAGIGFLLLITGSLLVVAKQRGANRKVGDLNAGDAATLGVAQAFAVVPGLSRSGITVAVLLLSKFREDTALRLSFLMSLPVVLLANIMLNWSLLTQMDTPHFVGLISSFIFGLLTIHGLLLVAKKVNFGKFVVFFGLLLLAAAAL